MSTDSKQCILNPTNRDIIKAKCIIFIIKKSFGKWCVYSGCWMRLYINEFIYRDGTGYEIVIFFFVKVMYNLKIYSIIFLSSTTL